MFHGCNKLTYLDVSNFNTKNVTDMPWMFSNCFDLISLNLRNFDTKNVTAMKYMFYACHSLSSLDLSSFDTKNVKDMSNMFDSCSSLSSIFFDRATNFINRNTLMDLRLAFANDNTIVSIEFFDEELQSHKVNISNMLENCVSLTIFSCPEILLLAKVFKGEDQVAKNCINFAELSRNLKMKKYRK